MKKETTKVLALQKKERANRNLITVLSMALILFVAVNAMACGDENDDEDDNTDTSTGSPDGIINENITSGIDQQKEKGNQN